MAKKLKVHLVVWDDACSLGGWFTELSKAEMSYLVATVGFIVHRDKNRICVAQSMALDADGTYADVLTIPTGMVKKVVQLK